MGVPGMVIGVPAFAVIFALIRSNINKGLVRKGLPIDRDRYSNIDYVNEENHIVEMSYEQKEQLTKNENFFTKYKKKIMEEKHNKD